MFIVSTHSRNQRCDFKRVLGVHVYMVHLSNENILKIPRRIGFSQRSCGLNIL